MHIVLFIVTWWGEPG